MLTRPCAAGRRVLCPVDPGRRESVRIGPDPRRDPGDILAAMHPERWRELERIFHAASELSGEERNALLDRECAGALDLRREVESLLSAKALGSTAPVSAWRRAKGESAAGDAILPAGTQFGPYRIEAMLGAGGMGRVYRATDTRLGRTVAIKTLAIARRDDERQRRFEREARAVAALNDPRICALYDIGEAEGIPYLVMEFVPGETLSVYLQGRLVPPSQVSEYGLQIAGALAAAHSRGIIHRDLKPGNIMVTESGIKLLDFGLADFLPRSADTGVDTVESSLTATGAVIGTPAYMAPEQLTGLPCDTRTDVFALGLVLYEMATGVRAFGRDSQAASIAAVMHEQPTPPSAVRPELDHALDGIIARCLAKAPQERYRDATEAHAALFPLAAAPPTVPRRRWYWAGAAAVPAAALLIWMLRPAPKAFTPRPAQQLTFDGGIAATAAVSPDGKLVAFASDRAQPGKLDIWLRQVAGSGFVRLTSHPGTHFYPRFSPDGSQVYFLDGDGALYAMPAVGGPARKIAGDAGPFDISARGDIAFLRRGSGVRRIGPLFLLPPGGSSAIPWRPECIATVPPVWSPDGDSLLFFGNCGNGQQGALSAPREGGDLTVVAAGSERLSDAGAGRTAIWTRIRGEPWVVFPAGGGSGFQIVRSLAGRALLLTEGSGTKKMWPALSILGDLFFTAAEESCAIWHWDPDSPLPPVKLVPAAMGHFGASRDGQLLAFGRLTANDAGELVVRNLATGSERVFAEHQLLNAFLGSLWPQVSPDGGSIAYRVVGKSGGIYLLTLASGELRRVAPLEQFQLPSDWSPDSRRILGECPPPRFGVCELEAASGKVSTLVIHPKDELLYPSWSWDGRAITFMRRVPRGVSNIWYAPVNPAGVVAPEAQWVRVSSDALDDTRPRFSADGRSVYFVREGGGVRRLVRQGLDQPLGRRTGPPHVEVEQPVEITAMTGGSGPYPLVVVTRRGLLFSSTDLRGNLYSTRVE